MPNCFTLTKKGDAAPMPLVKIDEELCELLGRPVDPQYYVAGWFNTIGFGLATGQTWDQLRETFTGVVIRKCIDYLEANYEPNAWVEVGK